MKITLPLKHKEHVGTRVRYEEDKFYFDDRGTIQGATIEEPIYDTVTRPTVVFDKDFHIKRRCKSMIAIVVLNGAVALLLPFVLVLAVANTLRKLLGKGCDVASDKVIDLLASLGHHPRGYRWTNREMLRSVFS